MRQGLVLVSTIAMLGVLDRAFAQQPSVIGSWTLVAYTTETADGTRSFPLGEDAVGMAIYLPNGRVSIQFMKRDRPRFKSGDAWRGTLEEERAAFEGCLAMRGDTRLTWSARRSPITLRSARPRTMSVPISRGPSARRRPTDAQDASANARWPDLDLDTNLEKGRLAKQRVDFGAQGYSAVGAETFDLICRRDRESPVIGRQYRQQPTQVGLILWPLS